ncbi:hypothetical protein ACFSFY_02530 [Sporosarcina siberiensis]|uniref:Uncharacterized protein n=1 Tax=Sporosarcina siberiensis TaxID=1365606 RepID=A0ABW4SDS4_9BACL
MNLQQYDELLIKHEELEREYYETSSAFHDLENEFRNYRCIVDQVWGNPPTEPIPDKLKITPDLANEIIKTMQKIKRGG